MSYDTVAVEGLNGDRWYRVVNDLSDLRGNLFRNIFLAPPILNMKAINDSNIDESETTCIQRCYETIEQMSIDSSMNRITDRAADMSEKIETCINDLYDQRGYRSWTKNTNWISAELFCCICNKSMHTILRYYTAAVEKLYDYEDKRRILSRLQKALFEKYSEYPVAVSDDSLDISVSNALYSLLLLGAEKNIKKNKNKETSATALMHEKISLPLEKVLIHFRSTPNRKKDELEDYEKVIVAYPAKSIERYFALKQLWESSYNFYAGWDLSSIIDYGDTLWSADGKRKYIIPSNHAEALIILKKIDAREKQKGKSPIPVRYQMEKDETESLLTGGERKQYFPALLQQYETKVLEYLKPEKSISNQDLEEIVGKLRFIERHEFIESKRLQYKLYKKLNNNEKADDIKRDIINADVYAYSKEAFETFMLNDSVGTFALKEEQYQQGALLGSVYSLRKFLCSCSNKEIVVETCINILANEPSIEQIETISEIYEEKLKQNDNMDIEKDVIPLLTIRLKMLIDYKACQMTSIQKNDFSGDADKKIYTIRNEIDDIRRRIIAFQQWYSAI